MIAPKCDFSRKGENAIDRQTENSRFGGFFYLTSFNEFIIVYAQLLNLIQGIFIMDEKNLARIFKVLSVETRVRMINLLKKRILCVNAIAKALDITPAGVSQHLRVLRDAGIVSDEKRGYFVHYRVNEETLSTWREIADNLLRPKEE
jgi:DNA-binding transcriptional ArsR family regulator